MLTWKVSLFNLCSQLRYSTGCSLCIGLSLWCITRSTPPRLFKHTCKQQLLFKLHLVENAFSMFLFIFINIYIYKYPNISLYNNALTHLLYFHVSNRVFIFRKHPRTPLFHIRSLDSHHWMKCKFWNKWHSIVSTQPGWGRLRSGLFLFFTREWIFNVRGARCIVLIISNTYILLARGLGWRLYLRRFVHKWAIEI